MTFEQIKFAVEMIRKFENQKKETSLGAMENLLDRVKNYFRPEINFDQLFLRTYQFGDTATHENFIDDCNAMIFTIEGLLAKDKNYPTARDILKDIERYKKCKSDTAIKKAIKEIYFSYSDRIKFSKVIEKIISDDSLKDPLIDFGNDNFDKTLLDGMLRNLENYANELCIDKPKSTGKEKQPSVVINNNNNFNASVDINIAIENAREELENVCLSTDQEKEVKNKIEEIEKIIKSKESKKSKWAKIGSVLKWITEQGIQVAGIVLPLVTSAIK